MSLIWDSSWSGTSRNKTVQGALDRTENMLTKSLIAAKSVNRDADAKQFYTATFNDPMLRGLQLVQDTIELMLNRIVLPNQELELINIPTIADFNKLNVGALPPNIEFKNIEAFVIQAGVSKSTKLKMFICPAFYTGDVFIPRTPGDRSGTGTILHELSHGVAATKDNAYSWEAPFAGLSWLEHAENADTYRQYCQSFD